MNIVNFLLHLATILFLTGLLLTEYDLSEKCPQQIESNVLRNTSVFHVFYENCDLGVSDVGSEFVSLCQKYRESDPSYGILSGLKPRYSGLNGSYSKHSDLESQYWDLDFPLVKCKDSKLSVYYHETESASGDVLCIISSLNLYNNFCDVYCMEIEHYFSDFHAYLSSMASEQLKRTRSGKKSYLTRKVNEINRLVAEDEREEVVAKFDYVKSAFKAFAESHYQYHDSLTEDDDLQVSEEYFESAQIKYTEDILKVRKYVSEEKKVVLPAAARSVPVTKLPPTPQPDVFTGKAESYPMWKAAFNTLIDKHDIGYGEKMFFLKAYTSGEAQGAIEALFLCPDQHAYESALKILEERFGSSTLVTAAFRRRLENWAKIGEKDGKALQRFADFLTQICVAKKTYKSLSILDDEFENKKLVKKLPGWLTAKWIEIVVTNKTFPSFERFKEFICAKAAVANHPLWSHQGSSEKGSSLGNKFQSLNIQGGGTTAGSQPPAGMETGSRFTPRGGSVGNENTQNHSSNTGQRVLNCHICNDASHKVTKCPAFTNMNLTERKRAIMTHRLCFGCLNSGHMSNECRSRHTCAVCKKRHPTLLHDYSKVSGANNLQSHATNSTESDHSQSQSATNMYIDRRSSATTMVIPVVVQHPSCDKEVLVYALLDTQSNTHFITNELVKALNISGHPTTLELTTLTSTTRVESEVINDLKIRGVCANSVINLSRCFTRESIPCNRNSIPTQDTLVKWPHLSNVDLPPYHDNAPIGLLIGFTCPDALRPIDVIPGSGNEPFGWKTKLGWCIVGLTEGGTDHANEIDNVGPSHVVQGCIALRSDCREVILNPGFDTTCQSEFSDLSSDMKYSCEDFKFMKVMRNRMFQRTDGRVECPLPVKVEPHLPNNRGMAVKRLDGLKPKFIRDIPYQKTYTAAVEDMVDSEFAELAVGSGPIGRTWYIPHHGVSGRGKLRVVFDCSAQCQGISLNDILLQGPDMLNTLMGILLRFRLKAVALVCDVQKMYHQFKVAPDDKDLLRFLWWPKGDYNSEPLDYRMTVHIFGATSSPGVATYALRKIAADHAHKHQPEASEFVLHDFYVDDGVTSVDTDQEAHNLFSSTQALLAEGKLKCHKVMSNSDKLMELIPDKDRAPENEGHMHKLLGVTWDVKADELCIPLQLDVIKFTRRSVLSAVASVYDPLGFVSPLLLEAKILLQQMCKTNCSWDEPLPVELSVKFQNWCEKLSQLNMIRLSRWITPGVRLKSVELHHFADACNNGLAACSYLRTIDEHGEYHVGLLMAKCRVVPLKPVMSVPRLELMAAVLAVKLASILKKELPLEVSNEYFWTDSTIVLGYIQNEATRFKVFVANRVQIVHDGSSPEQWHHISGASNPADDGSRAVLSDRWFTGPDFLYRDFVTDESPVDIDDGDVEVRAMATHSGEPEVVQPFKGWFSTKKVWAWVLRFAFNCRKNQPRRSGDLTVDEIERAQVVLLRIGQREFSAELDCVSNKKPVPRSSKLHKLDIFVDNNGLVRVGGRLKQSSLSYELKHPVVMPETHVISKLIIDYYHRLTHHQGRGITAGEIRNHGFWIVKLNTVVKRLIQSCVICQRLRGKPSEQKMADLPQDRVTPGPPFTYVGCDLFGPFTVKSGRKEMKRYGVIFTCLVCRAVHLEVVFSLSTDSFMNAFRRFVALRGPVRVLRCDQGTNFVGAKQDVVQMGCDVIFNPPASSHRGGVWERLIGTSRRVLEGILIEQGSRLDDEGLATLLAEVAAVVNSRPLSVGDLNDPLSCEPITPNHLITMKSKVITRPAALPESVRTDLYALRQWKRIQYLIDLFWSRWKKELIQQSQVRPKWNTRQQNISEDDIVLVVDGQLHRSEWRLARVTKVTRSLDGLVRSVSLILGDRSNLERPIQKLVPIFSAKD